MLIYSNYQTISSAKNNNKNNHKNNKNTNNVQGEIIGGSAVSQGRYPFMVAILDRSWEGTDYDRQFCGGSIITQRHVLTAAHCVEDYLNYTGAISIVLGRVLLTSTIGETRNVVKISIHPGYASNTNKDVAVLELDRPVTTYTPIRLSGPSEDFLESDGRKAITAGWGVREKKSKKNKKNKLGNTTNELRAVTVPIVGDKKCKKTYRNLDVNSVVCAGREGKDACFSDSGGPLFVSNGSYVQIGIVQGGRSCGKKDYPGYYTEINAPDIASFIQQVISETPTVTPPITPKPGDTYNPGV